MLDATAFAATLLAEMMGGAAAMLDAAALDAES